MSRFIESLNALLNDATRQGVIDRDTSSKLRQMATDQQRNSGVLSLMAVISWLGASILGLGIILIISANWNEISPLTKLIGFFLLFIGVHAAGIYLRQRTKMVWIAEGLNFLGTILFLAGVGLVSQIYQVEGRAPTAILIWFIAIAPLAWCFRSVSISLLSIFSLILWLHLEQIELFEHSFIFSPASAILIEVGIGVALIGLSAKLNSFEPKIAAAFRGAGLLLLFFGIYMMGFYRHMADYFDSDHWLSAIPPAAALLLGAIGLAIGYKSLLPDNKILRNRLIILLSTLLATATAMLLTDMTIFPKGPDLRFFDFGWYRTFYTSEWILSIAAWILWFALAFWCVIFASRTNRRTYLNAGVLAVGLGVITRFFDLMGGLFETGIAFIVGGAVLLATCFAVEYWRRNVVKHLKHADQFHRGEQA